MIVELGNDGGLAGLVVAPHPAEDIVLFEKAARGAREADELPKSI